MPSRCTYLADRDETATRFGAVVLEVDFQPGIDAPNNWFNGAEAENALWCSGNTVAFEATISSSNLGGATNLKVV